RRRGRRGRVAFARFALRFVHRLARFFHRALAEVGRAGGGLLVGRVGRFSGLFVRALRAGGERHGRGRSRGQKDLHASSLLRASSSYGLVLGSPSVASLTASAALSPACSSSLPAFSAERSRSLPKFSADC